MYAGRYQSSSDGFFDNPTYLVLSSEPAFQVRTEGLLSHCIFCTHRAGNAWQFSAPSKISNWAQLDLWQHLLLHVVCFLETHNIEKAAMGLCNRGAQHHAGRPVPAASIARGYGYPESRRLKQSIYNYLWETTLTDCFRRFSLFPVQLARFWVLRTHAFSAAVALASVVTHGGLTKTAQAALGELRLAYDLFEKAALHGGRLQFLRCM
ncbi:hypothetical protein BKA93DRAFT_258954 [Sparassis latifolia]